MQRRKIKTFNEFYRERKYSGLFEEAGTNSVLIVGDSHSVDNEKGTPLKWTWSSLLRAKIGNCKIIAEKGKTTGWMLSQLTNELKENQYDKVIIWGGANDAFSNISSDKVINNLQKMVDMINLQGGIPYIVVGYDYKIFAKKGAFKKSDYLTPEQLEEGRVNLIELQSLIPTSLKNAVVIPAFNIDHSYTPDNMHGNSKAHKIVSEEVYKYITKEAERTGNTTNKIANPEVVEEIPFWKKCKD